MSASRFRSPESKEAIGMRTIARTVPSGCSTPLPSSVVDAPLTRWSLWVTWYRTTLLAGSTE
jgi:hypothetical protein